MVKKILSVALIFSALCCVALAGCENIIPSKKISAPSLTAVGNIVHWDLIQEADNYEVFVNGESVKTTEDNYYCLNSSTENKEVCVVAHTSLEGKKSSKKSASVQLLKTQGFTTDETLEINLTDNQNYSVSADVQFVSVSGTGHTSSIIIGDRQDDLVISLNNVTMTSSVNSSCIKTHDNDYDSSKKHYTVCLILNGENKLNGESSTYSPSQKPPENSEQRGEQGQHGGNGVLLPSIAITGNGSLYMQGGNGGNGGPGADSKGWVRKECGHGGNGGNGGCGILSTDCVVALNYTSYIKAYGGKSGKGGSAGANGSTITGPIISMVPGKYDTYHGKDGNASTGIKGNVLIFSGSVEK